MFYRALPVLYRNFYSTILAFTVQEIQAVDKMNIWAMMAVFIIYYYYRQFFNLHIKRQINAIFVISIEMDAICNESERLVMWLVSNRNFHIQEQFKNMSWDD